MMKARSALILLTVLVLVLTPLVAAERKTDGAKQRAIATAVVANSGIDWQPNRDYEGAELVVSGPDGEIFRGSFAAGMPLFYDFLDTDGNPLRDGAYHYELVFRPVISLEVREQMRYARESGDESIIDELRREGLLPSERMAFSGRFALVDGFAVDADLPEERSRSGNGAGDDPGFGGIRPQDQVILDDLIVDGSACIGFDCVNGESFGFDTIRIKENNLRIRAVDTSPTASFPSRDWQLTFNDSSNGGANKFSVDDIDGGRTPFTIEASAPSHSLYVDDGGRLGLGTSTPVVDVHI